MKTFPKLPLLLFFVLIFSQAAYSQLRYQGRVVEIIDGKTVVIETQPALNRLTAELQAIEVPEPGQELHETVKEHLRKLLLGREVEFYAWQLRLPRTIGQVFAGGVDTSLQMLRDGAAWYSLTDKTRHSSAGHEYRNAESQAKLEKRGVWGIGNLKPAWEFRAERERPSKPQQQQTVAARQDSVKDEETVLTTRARNFLRQQAAIGKEQAPGYGAGMWSDIDSYAAAGESKNAAGLLTKYESAYNIGYTATPVLDLSVPAAGNLRKAIFRVGYFYRGASLTPGQGLYLIGIWSESKNWSFPQANNLTIVADGRAVNAGKAYRFTQKGAGSVQELLLYRVSGSTLQKIVAAKTVAFKVGTYSTPVASKSQNTLNTLLVATQ